MTKATQGSKVKVHYTGKLDDGTIFDTSRERAPLEFTIGQGQVIPGFENAVIGMAPGDQKTATIPAAQAYGERREELVLEVGRDQIPPSIDPQIGQRYEIGQPDGQSLVVEVKGVTDEVVILDANPPLAGKSLTFEIQLAEVL